MKSLLPKILLSVVALCVIGFFAFHESWEGGIDPNEAIRVHHAESPDIALPDRSVTEPIVSVSARGWSLRPGLPPPEKMHPTTVVVNPRGETFNIGTTAYPDILPATLWIVGVPALNARFLLIRVPPAASGFVPMPVLYLDALDKPFLAGTILQHFEFAVNPEDEPGDNPRFHWDGEHFIRDILFQDIDQDGLPELVEEDVGKDGGTITYFKFGKDRTFTPFRTVRVEQPY